MNSKVVFLDRDGVICENRHHESGDERNYILDWEQFVWIPGSQEALIKLLCADYFVVVVSNQACIGKGFISMEQVTDIMSKMWISTHLLAERNHWGMTPNYSYCICPHTGKEKHPCSCRKPKPGLIYASAFVRSLSLKDAWMVGDELTDLKAGWAAGIRKLVHVGIMNSEQMGWKRSRLEGKELPDLASAVNFILQWDGRDYYDR